MCLNLHICLALFLFSFLEHSAWLSVLMIRVTITCCGREKNLACMCKEEQPENMTHEMVTCLVLGTR